MRKPNKKAVRCTKPELRCPQKVGDRVLAGCITCGRLHVVEEQKGRAERG